MMSGQLRLIILESDFIEASFSVLDWELLELYWTFIEMVKFGKLPTSSIRWLGS
jgi:hypothetical protein